MSSNTEAQANDSIWRSIAGVASNVQDHTLSAKSLKELLQYLVDGNLPIERTEFSVVYQDYGTEQPAFVVIGGEPVDKKSASLQQPFAVNNPYILACINDLDSEPLYFSTAEQCSQAGFTGYNSVLVVPMRLTQEKNIGAFIAHSSSENAYLGMEKPFDVLSDRVAFYMRINLLNRRTNRFQTVHNDLIKKEYQKETEILEILQKELKKWFVTDDVYVLLVNPFNLDKYLLACDKNKIIENFRQHLPLSNDELIQLVGNTIPLISEKPLMLNSETEIKQHGITAECKSWLGVRMRTGTDKYIGYVILKNSLAEKAYEQGEENFIDEFSDFVALVLADFRKDLRAETLSELKSMLLAEKIPRQNELYELAQKTLTNVYGKTPLAITRIGRATGAHGLRFNTIPTFREAFEQDTELEAAIKSHIESSSKLPQPSAKDLTLRYGEWTLLVAPMRIDGVAIGCFIIPAPMVGELTARYVDDLSDMVAIALDKQALSRVRMSLLQEFGDMVNRIPTSDLTEEKVIELAHQKIAEAMYSKNLYFALYNKDNDEVSFPFALKDGQPWEGVVYTKRPMNREKLGKTEEIILTGESIIHYTKREAIDWYSKPEHQDYAGDSLASWIGVPIFSEKGVIGVIAAYHPAEEFVYSVQDLYFLIMMSHHVSGLFRALDNTELKEANRRLKENSKLIESQEKYLRRYLAKKLEDLTEDAVLEVGVSIDATIEDLDRAYHTGDLSLIQELSDVQKYAKEKFKQVSNIINSIKKDADEKEDRFFIPALIRSVNNEINKVIYEKEYEGESDDLYMYSGQGYFYVCFALIFESIFDEIIKNREESRASYKITSKQNIHIELWVTPNETISKVMESEKMNLAKSILYSRLNGSIKIYNKSLIVEIVKANNSSINIGIAIGVPWSLRMKQMLRKFDHNKLLKIVDLSKNHSQNYKSYDVLVFDENFFDEKISSILEIYQCKKYLYLSDNNEPHAFHENNLYSMEKTKLQENAEVFAKILSVN